MRQREIERIEKNGISICKEGAVLNYHGEFCIPTECYHFVDGNCSWLEKKCDAVKFRLVREAA